VYQRSKDNKIGMEGKMKQVASQPKYLIEGKIVGDIHFQFFVKGLASI